MRIGYVHSRGFPSVEANVVQVVQTCRGFAALGHEVTLFVPRADIYASDTAALDNARELLGNSLPFKVEFVPRVRLFGRLEVLGSVRGTLRALRKHDLDLIYTRNPWSVIFLPRVRVPFIFEAHESNVHKRSKFLGGVLQSLIVNTSRTPHLVRMVTISDALKKVWESFGVPEAKLIVAHDAVDPDMFASAPDKATAREQLAIPAGAKVIVYTGALKKDRGIDLILSAASQLPDFSYYLVGGTDSEVAYWKERAVNQKLKNVYFPGRVAHRDIPAWLSASDILLMMWTWRVPTIRVCSPMKLFEYMAAKKHIVGPAFPTILEVIAPDREAVLFEPDNIEAMVEAIRKTESRLNDLAMPASARRKVESEYTWIARCRKILDSLPIEMHTK